MKKIIVMLLVLLAFTVSCGNESNKPGNKEGDIPGVDTDINNASGSIEDNQLGGVDGLIKYYQTFERGDAVTSIKEVYNVYLNADKSIAKMSLIEKYNGLFDIAGENVVDSVDFDNEIAYEVAAQYKVTDISPQEVLQHNSSGAYSPVGYKAKGYKLYKMKATTFGEKESVKLGGTGVWKNATKEELATGDDDSYCLMKEEGNNLYMIYVYLDDNETPDTADDKYTLDDNVDLGTPINDGDRSEIFTKL